MLTSPKLTLLQELIAGSTREELIWLNGYLAGLVAQGSGQDDQAEAVVRSAAVAAQELSSVSGPSVKKITVTYGTETGNSRKLATDFAAKAKKNGIAVKLAGLDQYRLTDLAKEEYFFTVISTQGDGEPPAAAKKFYDHIHQNGLKLEQLRFGVLALGDTSYPLFCKAGEDIDLQLSKAGAHRIISLEKCDVDYEDKAGGWFDKVLDKLSNGPGGDTGNGRQAGAGNSGHASAASLLPSRKSSGKKTYSGTVLANIVLNDRGSAKQTHHLEIAAEDLDYLPGDSLGIIPSNPSAIVSSILSLTGVDPARKLIFRDEDLKVADLLYKKLNIVYLPERVVKKYAAIVGQDIPETKIGLLDLLKIYPVRDAAQFLEVVAILEPITPRLYSISSSPQAHPGEVHLTVALDRFSVNGEQKHGLCSDMLSRLPAGEELEFYIHRNSQFRLPDPEADIVMIGPGTGIAPFRSFLAERDAGGSAGRNWLFFGDQHFTTDFLYQTEIQSWVQTGVLTRINTAFSRDRANKVYVQHKMLAHGAALFEWIESGAFVYLCGARDPMSIDVENTLLEIIRLHGKKTEIAAASYLDELRETGRFLKDVY